MVGFIVAAMEPFAFSVGNPTEPFTVGTSVCTSDGVTVKASSCFLNIQFEFGAMLKDFLRLNPFLGSSQKNPEEMPIPNYFRLSCDGVSLHIRSLYQGRMWDHLFVHTIRLNGSIPMERHARAEILERLNAPS